MMAGRTFGTKLAAGFGLTVGLTLLIAATSVGALTFVVNSTDAVIASAGDNLAGAQRLSTTMESRISDYRAFLLNGRPEYLDATERDRTAFLDQIARLRTSLHDQKSLDLLETVAAAEAKHAALLAPVIERRKAIADLREISQLNATSVAPARQAVQDATAALVTRVGTVV